MDVTVGTFNLRNLFSQYNFKGKIDEIKDEEEGATLDGEVSYEFDQPATYKIRTYWGSLVKGKDTGETNKIAQRILDMNVDVLAVQEVEDIDTLREFNREYLHPHSYRYCVLVEGNDPRLIDLGVLSRLPIGGVTSWKHAIHPSDPSQYIFGRDLLEVEILNSGRSKTLFKIFNNHLKSHYVGPGRERAAGRLSNNERRTRQAEKVAEIVKARTRPNSSYIILGDMNDPPDSPCLQPFVGDPELNLTNALTNPQETGPSKSDTPMPSSTAWTHRYKPSGQPAEYELYDQIWLSSSLAQKQTEAWIERRTLHKGDGSDHDPAWIKLQI
jgi:endonuclease/exonuclease/phosphatase family metal-dependent hydrolase